MRIRLSTKLALLTTLGVTVVLAAYGWARIQREQDLFDSDMRHDHAAIGHALRVAALWVATRSGPEAVPELIADADLRTNRAKILWLQAASNTAPQGANDPEQPTRVASTQEMAADGSAALVSRVNIDLGHGAGGQIVIRESLHERDVYLRETAWRTLLIIALLSALCLAVISVASWVLLQNPLSALVGKVQRVGRGDLSGPLQVRARDELGLLAEALNEMCVRLAALQTATAEATDARIAALEQLRHANRLTTVGTLASGIAHELGTPLNVIAARSKMVARGKLQGEQAAAAAEVVIEQAARMTAIIRQLLDFVRLRAPKRRPERIHALCAHSLELLEQLAAKHSVQLELTPEGQELIADVDAAQLGQVLTNLIVNAVQAQPMGGRVELSLGTHAPEADNGAPTQVWIRVQDQGVGMAADVRERLFEPFFTTKDVGEGTGLGLAVTHGIVAEHGGRIEVQSTPGEGSRFTVYLPITVA